MGNVRGGLKKIAVIDWCIVKDFGIVGARRKQISQIVASKTHLFVCDGYGNMKQYNLERDDDPPIKWKHLFPKPIKYAAISQDGKYLSLASKKT